MRLADGRPLLPARAGFFSLMAISLPLTGAKRRFVVEYPMNASPKILFPYLASAQGLAQWFCDDVRYEPDHRLNFLWDQQPHYAEQTGQRLNRSVRFVFLDERKQPVADADYLDFSLEASEITDEVFLRITDYSEVPDDDERQEQWDGLVSKLRDQVGG